MVSRTLDGLDLQREIYLFNWMQLIGLRQIVRIKGMWTMVRKSEKLKAELEIRTNTQWEPKNAKKLYLKKLYLTDNEYVFAVRFAARRIVQVVFFQTSRICSYAM